MSGRKSGIPTAEGTVRLRVGHLVTNFLRITENWIYTQILAAPKAIPVILNRGAKLDAELFPVPHACHLADLSPGSLRKEAESWESFGYSREFSRACRRFECNVLHAHFGTEGILALPLARHLGVPLVTSFYGYDAGSLPRDDKWRRALTSLFAHGTLFLAEGPALSQSLERLGCPPDRIRLMPIPVLLPARLPRHDSKQIPQILICGRLVEKKGVDDSLRAIAALRRLGPPSFECVVVGDGPEREALCALSRALALDDCVRFAGFLPPAVLRQVLARSPSSTTSPSS
jgi:glycosyltransferase involved in cell wall biosynthesis